MCPSATLEEVQVYNTEKPNYGNSPESRDRNDRSPDIHNLKPNLREEPGLFDLFDVTVFVVRAKRRRGGLVASIWFH